MVLNLGQFCPQPLGGHLAVSGRGSWWGRPACWHLVGKGQRCCFTSCSAPQSPPHLFGSKCWGSRLWVLHRWSNTVSFLHPSCSGTQDFPFWSQPLFYEWTKKLMESRTLWHFFTVLSFEWKVSSHSLPHFCPYLGCEVVELPSPCVAPLMCCLPCGMFLDAR